MASPAASPKSFPGAFDFSEPNPALRKRRRRHIVTQTNSHVRQAQTPQQRAANARFAKQQETKMGKPPTKVVKREVQKSPISRVWIIVLGFVLCGGLIFELLRLFF